MAATIPPALKSLDITRFAVRAAQVEKAKPVIAYWCKRLQVLLYGVVLDETR
jgi:vacuolar protein sorting-associated protein VTA1